MASKEIIVLSGSAHKGAVKVVLQGLKARGNCTLDFRPHGAKLYLIGDKIAQVALDDVNTEFEVPFSSSGDIGCVVRSSSVTMFGGRQNKSDMLLKIDEYIKRERQANAVSHIPEKEDALSEQAEEEPCEKDVRSKQEQKGAEMSVGGLRFAGDMTRYDGNNFYYAVKPQIDELFICYPAEPLLEEVVPNSKWVRVDAEDGYYVVGVLYDGNEPSFICYGVPECVPDAPSPKELEDMCVWLPLNAPTLVGYWMIYQSAKTGEIIR